MKKLVLAAILVLLASQLFAQTARRPDGFTTQSDNLDLNRSVPMPVICTTGTAAVNTGVTITIAAVPLAFHYITRIELVKLYSVIGVAAGAGTIITSTNLPNAMAWTTEQNASPAGTAVTVINWFMDNPLKSSVVNTATTIVAPAQLQTIWRMNVCWYNGI